MGDHADEALDRWLDGLDEDREDDEPLPPAPIVCRCCGTRDLHWAQVGDKWRLFYEDDGMHVCPVRPLPQAEGVP